MFTFLPEGEKNIKNSIFKLGGKNGGVNILGAQKILVNK